MFGKPFQRGVFFSDSLKRGEREREAASSAPSASNEFSFFLFYAFNFQSFFLHRRRPPRRMRCYLRRHFTLILPISFFKEYFFCWAENALRVNDTPGLMHKRKSDKANIQNCARLFIMIGSLSWRTFQIGSVSFF